MACKLKFIKRYKENIMELFNKSILPTTGELIAENEKDMEKGREGND